MPREVVDRIALLLDPSLDLLRGRLATLPVPKSVFTKSHTTEDGFCRHRFDLDSSSDEAPNVVYSSSDEASSD